MADGGPHAPRTRPQARANAPPAHPDPLPAGSARRPRRRVGSPGAGSRSTRRTLLPRRGRRVPLPSPASPARPVKDERAIRVRLQFPALAALVAGVEDETALVKALEEDHARRGTAHWSGCSEGHGVGLVEARSEGLVEPAPELLYGVGAGVGLLEPGASIFLAEPGGVIHGLTSAPTSPRFRVRP